MTYRQLTSAQRLSWRRGGRGGFPRRGSGKQQGSDASRGAIPDEHHPCFAAQRVLYRPEEAAAALGIGRSLVYEEIRLGRLQTVRIGKGRRPKVYGDTKTEVRQKMRDLRKEGQSGVKAPANCTVADAVNDWLERGLKGRDEKGTLGKNRSIPLERIAQLVGHTSQATTEAVYRKQLRPVIIEGAEAMDVGLWRLLYFAAVQQMYGQRKREARAACEKASNWWGSAPKVCLFGQRRVWFLTAAVGVSE
ncbi:helix-turn-helix domain-containing protein [Streptomyces sp. NPDC053069]|uniref:helix-turn-helix domain-containing protein n=1 Tax=Streptomyces sp. NPDC053069 TaxID=3365695 RepID=UPI0037CFEACD